MQVIFLIGVAVMMPVMRRPPKNTLLRRRHGHPGDHELEPAAGFEGTMRKIAMIAGRDEKHADFIGEETGQRVIPFEWNEENPQGGEMNEDERKRSEQLNPSPIGQRDREGTSKRCHSENNSCA